jgi:hypothetical protein
LNPTAAQSVDLWVKVGYNGQINTCFVYYTTDGSNPEGAFGTGEGTTQVARGGYVNHDTAQNNIDWWKVTIPAQAGGTQVRYKVAVFSGGSAIGNASQSIGPISDAEVSGSKLYGLTQAAITNFNPATAVVWQHNDLNPSNTVTGLQSGFHILRARTFLPRPGQASVYNTFSQTFYYDGGPPTGLVLYPANGSTITTTSYTVKVITDSTVSGVNFNIQDSNSQNDDIVTGNTNGNGNNASGAPIYVAATPVSMDPTLDLQYTNDTQEFEFTYVAVPGSGTATINVQLNDYGTTVYTNHYTILSTTVNTVAPQETLEISSPATNGSIINLAGNTAYPFQACFTSSLSPLYNSNLFALTINGVSQPLFSTNFHHANAVAGCTGLSSITYNWTSNSPGTQAGANVLQIVYNNSTNGINLSDTMNVIVPSQPVISGFGENNQLVLWSSTPGVTYQVWATTDLTQPFQNISGNVPSQGSTTSYFDQNPAPQKFYAIEVAP